jgi:hypothetical protein
MTFGEFNESKSLINLIFPNGWNNSFISEELKELIKELESMTAHKTPYNPKSNPVKYSHCTINENIHILL